MRKGFAVLLDDQLNHPTPELALLATGRGDDEGFAVLYTVMAPRVYGLALKILRDPHLAQEVSQEVFLQIWQTAAGFDPDRGTALGWVMTLAHRRAVDRVRSTQAARRRDEAHAAEQEPSSATDATAATAQARLDAALVQHALSELSEDQRRAVELAYFGGHTHAEISALTQVPLGTAKYRIRQGLLRLRDSLAVPVIETA